MSYVRPAGKGQKRKIDDVDVPPSTSAWSSYPPMTMATPMAAPPQDPGGIVRVPNMCRYFARGFCNMGAQCTFAHIRAPGIAPGIVINGIVLPGMKNQGIRLPGDVGPKEEPDSPDCEVLPQEEAPKKAYSKAASFVPPGKWCCAKCGELNKAARKECNICGVAGEDAVLVEAVKTGRDAALAEEGKWFCEGCGEVNKVSRKACNNCGADGTERAALAVAAEEKKKEGKAEAEAKAAERDAQKALERVAEEAREAALRAATPQPGPPKPKIKGRRNEPPKLGKGVYRPEPKLGDMTTTVGMTFGRAPMPVLPKAAAEVTDKWTCAKCGEINKKARSTCNNCGAGVS
eukprot:TRINITY_DN14279_c0_g1_i5.p1 TRINITY_DN14279_c0_g1~~TRINITY_DN14279_c0_g1_i5.p1  ORF type:complete len:346 (+),score=68.65 TRINITY_DN14279_c0_g1_i5:164-1201(+)